MTPPGFVLPDMLPAAAEIFLLGMACIVLVVDVYLPERFRRFTYQLSQASLAGAALLVLATFPETRATTFEGAFVADPMAAVLKVFILVVSGFGLFYSRVHLEARRLMRGEYFVLGLFAVLGMLVLVSAGSFLTLYLGLELLSLSLYAMVALDRESRIGLRGGDEVLRARGAGLGDAAVRDLDDLRQHGQPRFRRGRRVGRGRGQVRGRGWGRSRNRR